MLLFIRVIVELIVCHASKRDRFPNPDKQIINVGSAPKSFYNSGNNYNVISNVNIRNF